MNRSLGKEQWRVGGLLSINNAEGASMECFSFGVGFVRRIAFWGLFLVGITAQGGEVPTLDSEALWTTLPENSETYSEGRVLAATFAQLLKRTKPAVVAIYTVFRSSREQPRGFEEPAPFSFDPRRLFPEVPRTERREGIGSGFIIRKDGYVVTNHHVVSGAKSILVRIEGLGTALPARVVGSDIRSDVALIKVDPPAELPFLPLGVSDNIPVGAWVVAVGNPYGLTSIATKGIVSGKGRTLGQLPRFQSGYFDYIQTDAAIDVGNSGGPLINLKGEVVGINTAINSRARGIGFAVPIDLVKAVIRHLVRKGRVVRAYLGISIDPVTWELANSFGLAPPRGVLVTKVLPGTPAERAGIKSGDIILSFSGKPVGGVGDMSWRAAMAWVGQPVEVEYWRGSSKAVLEVIPIARSAKKSTKKREKSKESASIIPDQLGLHVVDLKEQTANAAGLKSGTRGVVVIRVEAEAAIAGLRLGDVIVSINGKNISNKKEFERIIQRIKPGKMIRFYVLRQKGARYLALPKKWK